MDGRTDGQMDRQIGGWLDKLVLPMGPGRAVPKSLLFLNTCKESEWFQNAVYEYVPFSHWLSISQEPVQTGEGWLRGDVKGQKDDIFPPLCIRPTMSLVHHLCSSKSITKIWIIIILPLYVSDILIRLWNAYIVNHANRGDFVCWVLKPFPPRSFLCHSSI